MVVNNLFIVNFLLIFHLSRNMMMSCSSFNVVDMDNGERSSCPSQPICAENISLPPIEDFADRAGDVINTFNNFLTVPKQSDIGKLLCADNPNYSELTSQQGINSSNVDGTLKCFIFNDSYLITSVLFFF